MKISKYFSVAGLAALGLGAIVMLVAGCQAPGGHSAHASGAMNVASAGKSGKGGAQLWAENCLACHNVRSPSQYSDADWDVVMQHMRVRANLSAADTDTITKFLRSAN
ncbi:MAG: hypothetical protein ACOZE5_14520 [Verrucomicrobiota bacterium]